MANLFENYGVHAIADGQFGSTGKGVLAAWLAGQQKYDLRFDAAVSNAGPNSGHTFYHGDEKHVLKQLPTFAVASHLLGHTIPVFLTGGAVIDPLILKTEARKYPGIPILVHTNAVVVTDEDKKSEHSGSVAAVAGTRSGTGAAIARKVLRDPTAVFKSVFDRNDWPANVDMWRHADDFIDPWKHRIFMEVSQGYSLGINSQFYPKTTSRECTVAQGMADAGLPPRGLAKVYLSMRIYPIRVGNVDGFSSGNHYPDQHEVSWDDVGVQPELTTVTKRPRRIFTFSVQQAIEAVSANDPDFVFMNFMNYLNDEGQRRCFEQLDRVKSNARREFEVITGWGAKSEDVVW